MSVLERGVCGRYVRGRTGGQKSSWRSTMISAGLNVLVAILSRNSKIQRVGSWKVGDV
jgi:hypothetical protein